MQFFSSTKTKTEKRAIEEEWRMDSKHTYNSNPTGRSQNDILETVQVVTMLRAVMRSCTIPINPNYTKVDKGVSSNSGDRGLMTYVRKDVGINTFRSESFTMFVILGTHGSYELGAAHGEPHITLRSGSMTKDIDKEIVPSNIAWFSTLSGSDAVDRPTTGSSTLVVYTEKAGYACDESDYLNEDFRFTNDIPLQRREQLPDAIGIPSDMNRTNALKRIHERLDSSDGQYDKVQIALFANDDSATQNAYEPTPQQPNAAPAAPAGAGAKVVYQLWDAEYQCHFYTIADCQWLVARLIWEKRGFTGVSVPDLPDSDVHRKLFVHKGFASLVNDALEFSNHTVMKAIRDLRSTTGNNGREPFQLFQGADEIQHNTLLNEVMGDVMRATWTAVHNKEASILHALFQCAADKTTWSSIEERVMSAVSLLANIWERLVGEPDRVLGEDLTAVSKPIVHAFRQLFAWMTESQGEGYDTFHAGASIFSARGAWGRVLDDDDESATPSVYYLPRLKTYLSSMRGFDYFCMLAVYKVSYPFHRMVGRVPFGRFEVPLYPKGFVRDIQESLRILVLNSTPVAFRRYRENTGTTARLTYKEFTDASKEFQMHEKRKQFRLSDVTDPFAPPFHDAFAGAARALDGTARRTDIPPALSEPSSTRVPSGGAAQVTDTPQPTMPPATVVESFKSDASSTAGGMGRGAVRAEAGSLFTKGFTRRKGRRGVVKGVALGVSVLAGAAALTASAVNGNADDVNRADNSTRDNTVVYEQTDPPPVVNNSDSQSQLGFESAVSQPQYEVGLSFAPFTQAIADTDGAGLLQLSPRSIATTPPTSTPRVAPVNESEYYGANYGANYGAAYGAGGSNTNYGAAVGYDTNFDVNNINEDGFEDQFTQQDLYDDDALTKEYHKNKHQIDQIIGMGGGGDGRGGVSSLGGSSGQIGF